MAVLDLREELKRAAKLHPRLLTQSLFEKQAELERIATALPVFMPFKGKAYKAAMWILDWDHRIPSRDYILRLYVFYSAQGKAIGELAYAERLAQIESEDIFPEFDVSDFGGLSADETVRCPVGWRPVGVDRAKLTNLNRADTSLLVAGLILVQPT